jgi:hypothetical protein
MARTAKQVAAQLKAAKASAAKRKKAAPKIAFKDRKVAKPKKSTASTGKAKTSWSAVRASRRAQGYGLPKSDPNYKPRNDAAVARLESLVMHANSEAAATKALKKRFSAKGRADAVRAISGAKKRKAK